MKTVRAVMVRSAGLLLAGAVAGCGDSVHPVEGVVLLDGEPFEGVSLIFQPEAEGPIGFATADKGGVFRLEKPGGGDGVFAGDYVVTLSKVTGIVPDIMPPWVGPGAPAPTQAVVDEWNRGRAELRAQSEKEWVPTRYLKSDTTPLRVAVPLEEDLRLELVTMGDEDS